MEAVDCIMGMGSVPSEQGLPLLCSMRAAAKNCAERTSTRLTEQLPVNDGHPSAVPLFHLFEILLGYSILSKVLSSRLQRRPETREAERAFCLETSRRCISGVVLNILNISTHLGEPSIGC